MSKPKVMLLGKLPPPLMGPAIATKIILNSALNNHYTLVHVDTNVHKDLGTLGTWSFKKVGQNVGIYYNFISKVLKEKPDVILIPISQATLGFLKDAVFIFLAALMGRRVILQLRGSDIKNWLARSSWMTNVIVDSALRKAYGVIVLGQKLKYLFSDYFPDERIFVVPNGANYPGLQRTSMEEEKQLKILYLANLMPSKGIEDVLEAMKELKKRGVSGLTLDVVGNWTDHEVQRNCMYQVKSHHLPVTFHGPATGERKFRFLSEADVFVFVPRAPEGHPWVIVEALAAGLPIISTDQGAITESVINGVNGCIVPHQSPRRIADKIMMLLQDPELLADFGHASRTHYLNNFTEEKMVERLSRTIDRVLPESVRQPV